MPACAYTSAAHSEPPCGSTVSRSADMVGSERIAVPLTQATGPVARVGHGLAGQHHGAGAVGAGARLGVADRVPQHHRVLDGVEGDVVLVQVGVGVLQRVLPVLERDEDADVVGRLRAGMYERMCGAK